MLKKVLDKQRGGPPPKEDSPRAVDGRNDGVSTSRGDNNRQRQYHPLEAANPSTTRPPSTSTNDSEIMMRRDASAMQHHHHPTPISMGDASHDISPHSYEPPRYAPPVPSGLASVYHFNTASSPRDCPPPQMLGRPSPYPGETGTSGYMHGPHGEIYFMDNGRLESSPVGAAPHISPHHQIHHHAGAVRAPYLKENVPPQHRYRHHPHHHPYSTHSSSSMERQPGGHHMLADGGAGMYAGGRPDRLSPLPRSSSSSDETAAAAVVVADSMNRYEGLARENHHMREQLKEKDVVVSSLQQRVSYLEKQISELRQLPTGKISHIAVSDMMRIMEEYGSEVSNQTLPKRKKDIKKASIVRQFRRWNPEFFRYFIHLNGEWVPKLGKEGEIKRRIEKRRLYKRQGGSQGDKDDDGASDSYDS